MGMIEVSIQAKNNFQFREFLLDIDCKILTVIGISNTLITFIIECNDQDKKKIINKGFKLFLRRRRRKINKIKRKINKIRRKK